MFLRKFLKNKTLKVRFRIIYIPRVKSYNRRKTVFYIDKLPFQVKQILSQKLSNF